MNALRLLYAVPFLIMLATGVVAADLPLQSEIDYVSRQSIEWWFAAVVVLGVVSWTFMVRWLITQQQQARDAHARLVGDLLQYMREDHAKTVALLERAMPLFERVEDASEHWLKIGEGIELLLRERR